MIRVSLPVRVLALLVLCVGVLLIPTQARADTVTVSPGCEVHYDSGSVTADPLGGTVDVEAPSASADLSGCFVVQVCLRCLLTTGPLPPLPIEW